MAQRTGTTNNLLSLVEDFLKSRYYKEIARVVETGSKSLVIDYKTLDKFNVKLADQLLENPQEIIKIFESAVETFDFVKKPLNIRISNLPQSSVIRIRDIRSEHIGTLIAIEGQVKTASDVRPIAREIIFECPTCANQIIVKQTQTRIKYPGVCKCGRKSNFKIVKQKLVDVINITIEESPESLEGGEQPKRINAFLEDDLASPEGEKKVIPGNKVRLIGILREYAVVLRTGGRSTRYELILAVNNVEPIEREFESLEISAEDEKQIKELAKNPNIIKKIVKSIVPTILGHDQIKEALALQLFGGVPKRKSDGTTIRGDIHILLVGDPGVGKSQMLTSISKLAPKAVYVTGKGTSVAGLTASVRRDEFLKDWVLEAGALVLANKGIAIIDELDKMSGEDRVAMHEALAQQTVTINKANIHATLNAQSAVLAAANPKYGRFDPYATIHEQINLPPTLINRFDLIFPIRDLPEPKKDEMIAKHIVQTHRSTLMLSGGIDPGLLRKYIAYAKQRYNPVISKEAMEEIVQFYVKLRNKSTVENEGIKPIPISARQLEALIRLSEASARINLRNEVTVQDAKRAIKLLENSMRAVGVDPETGEFDIDRLTTGISTTQRSRIMQMKTILRELEKTVGENIPVDKVLEKAEEAGIEREKAEELIEKMKKGGEIYEPRHGVIRLMK